MPVVLPLKKARSDRRTLLDIGNDGRVHEDSRGRVYKQFHDRVTEIRDNFGRRINIRDQDARKREADLRSLGKLKAKYYEHKIARILFPSNFLDVVAADWRRQQGTIVSNRHHFDETYGDYRKKFRSNASSVVNHRHLSRMDVILKPGGLSDRIREAGLTVPTHELNIGIENGNPVFIETHGIDAPKLRQWLQSSSSNGIPLQNKNRVGRLLSRYEELVAGKNVVGVHG
ncbi:MAG: hypothetical protein V1708_02690 [Candidatus Micrarchaeota archaeon]